VDGDETRGGEEDEVPDDFDWEADGYRAIGRWVVVFSRLIGGMRQNMENRLRQTGDNQHLPSLAFAGAQAGQIADSFFGMCRLLGDLDDAETNIANQLQGENGVRGEIERRNKIAHGDWMIGRGNEPNTVQTYLIKVYPKEPHRRIETYSAEDLDRLSDRLHALGRMVWLFGQLALGLPIFTVRGVAEAGLYRVSDVLIAENVPKNGKGGRVVIAGPRASEIL
jgi:hypothetical protein